MHPPLSGPWPEWFADITLDALLTPLLWIGLIGFLGFIWWKYIHPVTRKWERLADDFLGESARPGVERRKGLMERVLDLEHSLLDARTALAEVRYHTQSNGGGSAYDEVIRRLARIEGACPKVCPLPNEGDGD